MKKLLMQLCVVIIVISNLSNIFAMALSKRAQQERLYRIKKQKEIKSFLTTTTIGDIQQVAKQLGKSIDFNLLENYLIILGLNRQSIPLTIRSRYDFLMQKKMNDKEKEKIKNAYNSLMHMLSVTPLYRSSLNRLVDMSKLEFTELVKENRKPTEMIQITPLPRKKLEDRLKKLFLNPEVGLKKFFKVPSDTSRYEVARCFEVYMKNNDLGKQNSSQKQYLINILNIAYKKYIQEKPLDLELYKQYKESYNKEK